MNLNNFIDEKLNNFIVFLKTVVPLEKQNEINFE